MGVILNRQVQFQRSTREDNGFGTAKVWAALGGVIRAARQDVSDEERSASGWVEALLVARFTIRSSAFARALTPADRLTHDGRTWEILGIKEAQPGRYRFLEITARARTDV